MLDKSHPCFNSPKSNCTLWRYMDLTKLLSLLENRKLFFPRADQFEDPYEGSWPKASVALMRDKTKNGGLPSSLADVLLQDAENQRREMYISCWFASEHESAAMWKLYLQSCEGIAIRTDHDTLCRVLDVSPLSIRASSVTYIDYDKAIIPPNNGFFPYLHKRLSFAHENELRAIVWAREDVNRPQIPNDALLVAVDIVPEDLIQAVHVSPTAPSWFGILVEQLLKRYGLRCPVEKSGLYERPTF
jgi:hypothetical protein